MDPYTLSYLAGHSDFATTRRYVHPQTETVLAAMRKATEGASGHITGHTAKNDQKEATVGVTVKDLKTNEKEWYARADSNGRPFAPEANALSS